MHVEHKPSQCSSTLANTHALALSTRLTEYYLFTKQVPPGPAISNALKVRSFTYV
jgi:hypothetical protein